MTTLHQSREFERIAASLRYIANRWWWVQIGWRLAAWLAVVVLAVLALAALAAFINLPSSVRWFMLIALLTGPPLALLAMLWPVRRRLSPAQAARQIEQNVPGLENRFINAVQLADNGHLFDPDLVRQTLDEIAKTTSDAPVDQAVATRRLAWASLGLLLAGVAFLLMFMFAGERMAFGMSRIWNPSAMSWVGQARIDVVRPGDATALAGDRLVIEADVSSANKLESEPSARLFVRWADASDYVPLAMRTRRPLGGPSGSLTGAYSFIFTSVDKDFDYYVAIGDTNHRDRPYHVSVESAPQVADLQVEPAYPAYLSYEQPTAEQTGRIDGNFDAPVGATAKVTVRMNRPIVSAELALAGVAGPDGLPTAGQTIAMTPVGADRTQWTGSFLVSRSLDYRLIFRDQRNQVVGTLPAAAASDAGDGSGNFFTVTARPDTGPMAQVLRPGADSYVKPGGVVDIRLQASDDHGLTSVKLMMAKVRPGATPDEQGRLDAEPAFERHVWSADELKTDKGTPRKVATINYQFDLRGQESRFAEGDRLLYWVEATDNRDLAPLKERLGLESAGRQSGESARFVLTIKDPAELLAQRKKLLQLLTAELTALLKEQQAVRADAAALGHGELAGDEYAKAAGEVKTGQFAFADHLMRLAKGKIIAFDVETKPLQTSLLVLAYNDSADARDLADVVTQVPDATTGADQIRGLVGKQDRIIAALESLLGLIGKAIERTEDQSQRTEGTDLPPDAQAKLRDLAKDLEKFIDQQKRVIDVSQTLAKKPVDDFTDEDLAKLAELAAQQEKWEKFLEEQIKDFSKLAEQDFSNPTLLKELIEIKTDVVMAKDALKKKAVEIAVPLEEAGLEMAEETVTNIEKWLPDTPDREKWSMEEPLDQKDVPMAELPKELEDLMGPLMEEEEDLFDEIEDVTSKWTDSLDKGAGWDAMDGPISNMSAKGVTGNRLPNTSEISGRSGEGRTGKSAGEMVEDEATGKGGRRTPTRLSNDPFQKGQVKDSSKEPPGGATGGGKLSGVAGEGLEGPVPPEIQQQLQRLAQKQASIRNKAEAVDARFRANNFNNFALKKALTIMREVEEDLVNNRYQNALRRKAVMVNNLQAQQMLLRGEIHVQADESPSLPDVVRNDIRNTTDSDLPPRYKDLAKQYLQELSEGDGK